MRVRITVILSIGIFLIVLISFFSLGYVSVTSHHYSSTNWKEIAIATATATTTTTTIETIERDKQIIKKDKEKKEENFKIWTEKEIRLSHDYNGDIYLDWIRESYQFNYLNYKSFESLLATYSEANFEFTIIGPQAANYYKLGNLMRFV